MNYKPSDTMNLVHEVKKLGWHFTHSKENISINRHNVTLSLYREVDPEAWREENRKKQAAGVKFQNRCGYFWQEGNWNFEGNKEDYREASQPAVEPVDKIPHAAERALWKAQRAAGTNEVWQMTSPCGRYTDDIPVEIEPDWMPHTKYRVKPMKLTAMIMRKNTMSANIQAYEFFGTREEYRAECESCGYVVVSNIEEVKPKTVTYYFALCVRKSRTFSISDLTAEGIQRRAKNGVFTIIGDIEEREV